MAGVKSATADWDFDAVTIGFPGLVEDGQLVREPLNLGGGWLDANLERAFDRPVRIINDAALQALASYEGGRMLFVGFGTSIGAARGGSGRAATSSPPLRDDLAHHQGRRGPHFPLVSGARGPAGPLYYGPAFTLVPGSSPCPSTSR